MKKNSFSKKKVALITLGCAKNLVDSEVMTGYLHRAGYGFTDNPEQSDILIINTCGFIKPAKKEAVTAIKKASLLKKVNPELKLIVSGCYVQRNREELKKSYPEVDVWTGVNAFDRIVELIEIKPFDTSKNCFLYDHRSPRHITTSSIWAYTKISEGCSHRCSFCAIPLIKGKYRSRTISSIVREVRHLASAGIREVNLISQDSTFYGTDLGMRNGLPLLLEKLVDVPGLEWIRVLYGYPEEISDSLLDIMQEEKICSYLDLPFQHSSSKILKTMKRGLPGKKALHLLDKIRTKLPDIALRTSLIVGFPGETGRELEDLLDFVREARFDHLGVFVYSREEGTDCFSLGDPVPEDIKIQRKDAIMRIQAEISLANNNKYVGKTIDVLIEGPLKADPTVFVGRGRFQAPEVDGLVFIEKENGELSMMEPFQKVEITNRDVYDLYGKQKE